MKKIFTSMALLATLFACTKQEMTEQTEQPEGETQIIRASVNTPSKVAYSEVNPAGGAGITSVWETGDKFFAIQGGTKVVTFNLVSGAGTTSGVFEAETSGVDNSTSWVAVLGGAAVNKSTEIHCDYMNQGGTLASLSNYNYVKATSTGLTPSFDFANGTKLSYVLRIKLPAGIKCIEYTPSAWEKVTSSDVQTVIYNGGEQNDFGPTKTSTITLSAASEAGDFAYIAFPPIDFSTEYQSWSGKQNGNFRTGIVITIMNDDSDNATKSTGYVMGAHREGGNLTSKGGLVWTLDMSAETLYDRPKPSDAILIATTNVSCTLHTSLTQATSSMNTYWAPFNLGASKVSESGLYIAYGEYWDNGHYGWGGYNQRHKPSGSYYEDIMTPTTAKIGSSQSNYYSISGSRYDAARVLWGSAWRMPHAVEIWACPSAGTKTYENIDGVNCAVYTVGGNSVKFPDTGFYKRTDDSDSKAITQGDVGYAYIRSGDKLQRTYTTSNTIYRQSYNLWSGTTAAITASDADGFARSLGFRGYPIRAVLASSTIVGN